MFWTTGIAGAGKADGDNGTKVQFAGDATAVQTRTEGDTDIDVHHTVEDTGIVLGTAIRQALGDKTGIGRFGDALVPLGHMGDAWDVAHAAVFLASDEAKFITGIELVVDGGNCLIENKRS